MSRRRKCSRKPRHITGNSNRYFFGLELLSADYLYQPENHTWVYWEDGESCWGQSWCDVHTLAAAIHHLKKHKEIPAGTKAVLVSGYHGKPDVILTVRKSWRRLHMDEEITDGD